MAVNALSPFGATRCTRDAAMSALDEFQVRFSMIAGVLGSAARVEPIPSFRKKADFDELNVLIDSRAFDFMGVHHLVEELSKTYELPLPWINNGSVLSVGLPLEDSGKFLQINLVSTPEVDFDFSLSYFSWNDLGNLMGPVAEKMGMKFVKSGLWLQMPEHTNSDKTILVTKDFEAALRLLGFDSNRWQEGFDSIDDIYQFVASSERFHPYLYLKEYRNHTALVEGRTCPIYKEFLPWIEAKENLNCYPWKRDKSIYIPDIFSAFPEIKDNYDQLLAKFKAINYFFDYEEVAKITGLEEDPLCQFMDYFRRKHRDNLDKLPALSNEQMHGFVNMIFRQYKNNTELAPTPF